MPLWGIHLTGATQVGASPRPCCRRSVEAGRATARLRGGARMKERPLGDDEVAVPHGLMSDGSGLERGRTPALGCVSVDG
jgi:hypothetical protein